MSSAIDILKIPNSVQVHVVSDLHINHKNIIEYSNRPFASLEEHNEALIRNWQERVQWHDIVLILGDLFMGPQDAMEGFLKRLPGRLHLIRGNHDQAVCKRPELKSRFELIVPYLEVAHRGDCAVLSHFPIEQWNNAQRGWYHLHGHSHGSGRKFGRRLDVGIDAFCKLHYAPRTWQEVAEYMSTQIYMAQDHHGRKED